MTEQDREVAIQTVKDILHVLHEKRYEDLSSCFPAISIPAMSTTMK